MNRRVAFFCALLLVLALALSGCAGEMPSAQADTGIAAPVSLSFALAREAGEATLTAATLAAQELERLSGGQVTARIVESRNLKSELARGTELILMDNATLAEALPHLQMLSSEFLFTGYEHMSVSLNAPQLLQMMSSQLQSKNGYRPLAALYAGSWDILSSAVIDSMAEFSGTRVSPLATGISDLFLRTYSVEKAEQGKTEAGKTLLWTEVKPSAGIAGLPEWDAAYLTKSAHRVDVVWLLVSERFYSGLSREQEAYLQEGVAALREHHDSEYLRLEQECYSALSDAGLRVYSNDFEELRADYFYKYSQAMYESAGYDENLHYRIDSLSHQY